MGVLHAAVGTSWGSLGKARFTMISVDELIPAPSIVRLWKLDVNGHEMDVLRSAKQVFLEGRVDIIQMELIDEEVHANSELRVTKRKVLEYLEQQGFNLYAQIIPDRLPSCFDSGKNWQCTEFLQWHATLGIADVGNAWEEIPFASDGSPVLPASEGSRYAYGSNRAQHFEYIPFCTKTPGVRALDRLGEAFCMMHYVAVRKGSAAEQSPLFSHHRCTENFRKELHRRLVKALKVGHAKIGGVAQPLFTTTATTTATTATPAAQAAPAAPAASKTSATVTVPLTKTKIQDDKEDL